jgi:hypothetical protein
MLHVEWSAACTACRRYANTASSLPMLLVSNVCRENAKNEVIEDGLPTVCRSHQHNIMSLQRKEPLKGLCPAQSKTLCCTFKTSLVHL